MKTANQAAKKISLVATNLKETLYFGKTFSHTLWFHSIMSSWSPCTIPQAQNSCINHLKSKPKWSIATKTSSSFQKIQKFSHPCLLPFWHMTFHIVSNLDILNYMYALMFQNFDYETPTIKPLSLSKKWSIWMLSCLTSYKTLQINTELEF